ncbi:acyl-CoA thioesterase [Actinokineospora sp.]|uniref:acyl-CoA thioesterase n=1 Tax=Actinokineospora sp. TaxID=1872133 RepID=UPI0040381167
MLSYRYRHVVTLDETNLVGNVYFVHFVRWQGHCRELFLADHAPGVLAALRAGEIALVTVSCQLDYYAECFALDEVEVVMRLATRGGHRLSMDFDFRRAGERVARGTQSVACLRRTPDGAVPMDLPAELSAALARFATAIPN